MIERRLGRSGTGSRAALSFEGYGHRLPGPQVGAIATMSRRGGGHVVFVTTYDASTVTIISGKHNGVVAEGVYDRRRIRGY